MYDGKRILILAGGANEAEIVVRCKKKGLYTIVSDYYNDWRRSPAKSIADEAWNISWKDIENLSTKCYDKKIDGVIAGFSEFTVDSLISLCNKLGKPCYINKEQLELTRDKMKFKEYCRKFEIPVVPEFNKDDSSIVFPVIVKPTDRAGSIGIGVAYNKLQFEKCLFEALEKSPAKNVIVEEFMDGALKFDCYYEVVNNNPILIGTSDTLMLSTQKGMETMQKAWSFPSKHELEFINNVSTKVKKMIASLKFDFGYCTISFFYKNGTFYAFESGFRLSGEHSFNYQRITCGRDYLDDMIDYQMGNSVQPCVNTNCNDKMLVYNIYANICQNDSIQFVENEKELLQQDAIISIVKYFCVNMPSEISGPIKVAMCSIKGRDNNEIADVIECINRYFVLKCMSGRRQIMIQLSSNEVENCWN